MIIKALNIANLYRISIASISYLYRIVQIPTQDLFLKVSVDVYVRSVMRFSIISSCHRSSVSVQDCARTVTELITFFGRSR